MKPIKTKNVSRQLRRLIEDEPFIVPALIVGALITIYTPLFLRALDGNVTPDK